MEGARRAIEEGNFDSYRKGWLERLSVAVG
jgi:queuine tRNA-ribosyltransferase